MCLDFDWHMIIFLKLKHDDSKSVNELQFD